jgi:hypothetical protein
MNSIPTSQKYTASSLQRNNYKYHLGNQLLLILERDTLRGQIAEYFNTNNYVVKD